VVTWRRRATRVLAIASTAAALASGLTLTATQVAEAACHHFSIAATPNPVAEGAAVTVTVSRDGTVGGSHVDISTIEESAKAGVDFTAVSRTMNFTTEKELTLQVMTLDDHGTNEPVQAFRLHLSNPGGCANPNYVLDPDVQITISDVDSAPATATPAATARPTATATPAGGAATPTVRPASSPVPTEVALGASPSPSPDAAASPSAAPSSDSGQKPAPGSPLVPIVIGVVVVGALGAGAYVLIQRRSRP
jgi:hypothetical protein